MGISTNHTSGTVDKNSNCINGKCLPMQKVRFSKTCVILNKAKH